MAELCLVGQVPPAVRFNKSLETNVAVLLSDEKVFGPELLQRVRQSTSLSEQTAYQVASLHLLIFKQYLAGTCEISDDVLKNRISAWNSPSVNNNVYSVGMKQNLISLLEKTGNPELQSRANILLEFLRDTPNIKLPPPPPAKAIKMMADAAPVASRTAIATRADDYQKKSPNSVLLSDEKIFGAEISHWNQVKYGRFYVMKKGIDTLRLYLDGRASEADVQGRMKTWEAHESYSDDFSQRVRSSLEIQLTQTLPATLGADQKFIDKSLDAARILPPASKKLPQAPVLAGASVTKKVVIQDTSFQEELLSPVSILRNQFDAFNQVKHSDHYPLLKMMEAVRGYVRGNQDFTSTHIKSKINTWTENACYSSPISQEARSRLLENLALLEVNAQNPDTKNRIATVLRFIQATPFENVQPQLQPVQSSYSIVLTQQPPPQGEVLNQKAFNNTLVLLVDEATADFAKQIGADFALKALPTLHFDAEGYLARVDFTQVSAESGIKDGETMSQLLLSIGLKWRSIRFEANQVVPLGRRPSSLGGQVNPR